MIEFEDFMPPVLEAGFFSTKIGDFTRVVRDAKAWIESRDDIEIINVETVVLPNIFSEEGSTDTELRTSGDMSSNWYQVMRVWYRKSN